MLRYTVQLFGMTVFALSLIWFVGSGEAVQNGSLAAETLMWADTVHFDATETQDRKPANPHNPHETFFQDVKVLTRTALSIRNQYMEEVDTEEIIKAGIRGMLSDLDRYSVLMEKKAYRSLMESTHGKYEGLGMQIDSRDDHIVIVTPMEGTPAYRKGLRAGDIIWMIGEQSTEGMTSADASKLMRGKAGTSIELTIKRPGLSDLIEFEITRAIIELKSVNHYGVIEGTDIGYIRLSRFAEETSHELRQALSVLNEQNISSLIFDLRSNGGGLLSQAKETAELFLPLGSEIVYTLGQYQDSEYHLQSERPPLFPTDKPLVILVDEGTASASEIVSGAIQDWDRGLIMGKTTFGKGLVQGVFPLTADSSITVKLTTAKYYVPSGRCIQKPERQNKTKKGAHPPVASNDEEAETDSMVVDDREVFYTNGGRVVYGGGGIVPDIEIEPDMWEPIIINMYRKSLFFDYAVKYVSENPDTKQGLAVTDKMVDDFRGFAKEKDFTYKTALQVALEDLETEVADAGKEESFKDNIEGLKALIELEKVQDFDDSYEEIRKTIKREIVASIAGEHGVYEEITLKTDKSVRKAVKLLQTTGRYSELIADGMRKAEVTD